MQSVTRITNLGNTTRAPDGLRLEGGFEHGVVEVRPRRARFEHRVVDVRRFRTRFEHRVADMESFWIRYEQHMTEFHQIFTKFAPNFDIIKPGSPNH